MPLAMWSVGTMFCSTDAELVGAMPAAMLQYSAAAAKLAMAGGLPAALPACLGLGQDMGAGASRGSVSAGFWWLGQARGVVLWGDSTLVAFLDCFPCCERMEHHTVGERAFAFGMPTQVLNFVMDAYGGSWLVRVHGARAPCALVSRIDCVMFVLFCSRSPLAPAWGSSGTMRATSLCRLRRPPLVRPLPPCGLAPEVSNAPCAVTTCR